MTQKQFRLVLWLSGALLVVLGLGEAFARVYLGLGTPPLYVEHPTIEYLHKPNQDVRRFGNRVLINAYGMRSENFPRHRQPGEIRIMVFGDSVLNGGSLTDHAKLATTLLAKSLRARTGRQVTVGHISAGSWGPGNWLAYVREYGFFDADVVMLVASSHDYGDNPTFHKLDEFTHPTRTPLSALVEGATRYLPRYLPQLDSGGDTPEAGYAPAPADAERAHALGDLQEFLQLARQHGGKVVVLQHYEKRELGRATLPEGHAYIKALCEELQIAAVSLEPAFTAALQEGFTPYRDNIHLTDSGQQLLAEIMQRETNVQPR